MKNKGRNKRVTARVSMPPELLNLLKEEAAKQMLSVSSLIRFAINKYLK